MRLMYLTANAAYVFVFGDQDQIIDIDGQRFFSTVADAAEAVRPKGLEIRSNGMVKGTESMTQIVEDYCNLDHLQRRGYFDLDQSEARPRKVSDETLRHAKAIRASLADLDLSYEPADEPSRRMRDAWTRADDGMCDLIQAMEAEPPSRGRRV
jgi:hypothetical protein